MKPLITILLVLATAIFVPVKGHASSAGRLTPTAEASGKFEKVWNSDRVAELVGALLFRAKEWSAVAEKIQDFKGPQWEAYERAQQKIFNDLSKYGDCAVVQSLVILNDASGAEDAKCAIEKRGVRMLPILEYALEHPPFPTNEAARQRVIKECIQFIKNNPKFKGCDF